MDCHQKPTFFPCKKVTPPNCFRSFCTACNPWDSCFKVTQNIQCPTKESQTRTIGIWWNLSDSNLSGWQGFEQLMIGGRGSPANFDSGSFLRILPKEYSTCIASVEFDMESSDQPIDIIFPGRAMSSPPIFPNALVSSDDPATAKKASRSSWGLNCWTC